MDLGSAHYFVNLYTIRIAKNVGYSFDMNKNKTIFSGNFYIFKDIVNTVF